MKRNIKNLRIIRILLGNPKGDLSKYRIAKLSECSKPWVIEFLRKLDGMKLVKKNKVVNYDKLIDYYIEIMPKQKCFDFFSKDPEVLLRKSKLDYALTTYAAENILGHHLFPSRYDLYIKETDLYKWKLLILNNGLMGKGNLRLIFAYDDFILKEKQVIKGIKIVSMQQLLIDLKNEGGICVEAYNLLAKRYVQGDRN